MKHPISSLAFFFLILISIFTLTMADLVKDIEQNVRGMRQMEKENALRPSLKKQTNY